MRSLPAMALVFGWASALFLAVTSENALTQPAHDPEDTIYATGVVFETAEELAGKPRTGVAPGGSTTSPPPSLSVERSSLGTTTSIDMAASPCSPRTMSVTIEPRACCATADPSNGLGPSSRALRSRHPKASPPTGSGQDQSTRDIYNRRNRSVNRSRQCLKVVDRFLLERPDGY